jgi:hypothetical protein
VSVAVPVACADGSGIVCEMDAATIDDAQRKTAATASQKLLRPSTLAPSTTALPLKSRETTSQAQMPCISNFSEQHCKLLVLMQARGAREPRVSNTARPEGSTAHRREGALPPRHTQRRP